MDLEGTRKGKQDNYQVILFTFLVIFDLVTSDLVTSDFVIFDFVQ